MRLQQQQQQQQQAEGTVKATSFCTTREESHNYNKNTPQLVRIEMRRLVRLCLSEQTKNDGRIFQETERGVLKETFERSLCS